MTDGLPAELVVSPEGHVLLETGQKASEEASGSCLEVLQPLFEEKWAKGLLHLGIREFENLPLSFLFWRQFVQTLLTKACKEEATPPGQEELNELLFSASFLRGAIYLSGENLLSIWQALEKELEVAKGSLSLKSYLCQVNPKWGLVGRICFHLAENKNNPSHPFAFLATYTTRFSEGQSAQHVPLKRALQEYAGENNRSGLLALLVPIQNAATKSSFLKTFVDSGGIFQPQPWSAHQAHAFLKDIPIFEEAGIMVRVPNWWNPKNPPRPKVSVTVGAANPSVLGLGSLLDFKMDLALSNGEKLTKKEWEELLSTSSPLVKVKGEWVEVDPEKLRSVLAHWGCLQKAATNGISMAEALRLMSGAAYNSDHTENWSEVTAGDWLKEVLLELKTPRENLDGAIESVLKTHLHGTLRPYQLAGVRWLLTLYRLKLGGCLADDMGLGKTIQVLALFLIIKHHLTTKKPHLLVVPASLLGNWQKELSRFAPSLRMHVEHSDSMELGLPQDTDCCITTYGFLQRSTWMKQMEWDLVILDEAQMIKNPNTKQTLSVKALKGSVRLNLTGTPVENRLGDLWSLFDFTSPNLLGSSKEFTSYSKKAISEGSYTHFVASLRQLTQPYILRRLKTDKTIIKDLPDKTEMQALCTLSSDQVRLYQETITELAQKLTIVPREERRGLVLASLLRLKQICNHPDQWLGYGDYSAQQSGKFLRLQEICEEIAAKQEKVLIFTQFREIIPALSLHLRAIFGCEGLELHGGTAIKKRTELVAQFQHEQGPPFFVLSLKAGGTGLTLTRASHVVHFDRWWNPSVENQATDRAYRIGQNKNVLVHKFVCRGTIEEKIDELIASKQKLAKDILHHEDEIALTELSDDALLRIVSLDIHKALGEV